MKFAPILLAMLLAAGCVVAQRAPDVIPDTPDRIESDTPPELQPTRFEDIRKVVVADVADVYYSVSRERWFRYWMDEWFIAFSWDGAWFPTSEGEVPEALSEFEPTPEEREERQLTREEELREIEEQLREIEREERGGKTREEELQEIEEELLRIEREERGEEIPQEGPPESGEERSESGHPPDSDAELSSP